MMTEKIVQLSKSYTSHKTFDTVTLREPTFKEYIEFGEVFEMQPGPQGGTMIVRYTATIEAYLERICVDPPYEELAGLNLADAKALTKAVEDFFTEAAKPRKPQKPSPSDSASQ